MPMGKIWILDTETKGTGAEMVPLERALERRRSAPREKRSKASRRSAAPARQAASDPGEDGIPREPSRFRVVSALSGQVLAEDASAREVVAALAGLRSLVDARVYVLEPGGWRPLTMREQKLLREFRDRVAAAA
jgi:hypothetical protein